MMPPAAPGGPLGRLVALLERTNRLAGVGAGLILLAMVGMIGREAIGRYFFNAPTDWVVELSGYLLVGIVFMGGAFILQEGAHLRVDIFYSRFSRRGRARVDLLGALLALPYLGFVLWQSALLSWQAFQFGERSTIMRWPIYLPELFVPVGVALLLLQLLVQLAHTVATLREERRG
jgi:TRAP-type mannitol/chloroaromatic compound transport system permease small subunit